MSNGIERLQNGGISLLRRDGDGNRRPLVMLHGIGSNAQSFAALITAMAAGRPLLAWDAPGYGASAPLAVDWPSEDDYSNALAGLLDRLGIGHIDLLGHSMGALIAGRFAVRHPDRVGRLMLGSPALGYGTTPGAPLAPAAGNRLNAFLAEGGEKFAATRGPKLVHAHHHAPLVAGVVKAMSEVKLPGYAQASRMLSCADLIADSARLSTQTLVFVGGEDEITPPANCRRLFDAMHAANPGIDHRFEIIPDAGHAVPQERPQAVATLVDGFAHQVARGG